MVQRALMTGLAGSVLTEAERGFLRGVRPCGIILFARNCRSQAEIAALVSAARDAVGGDLLVAIDQEGGRVQRLRPPLGRALPPAAAYGRRHARDPETALRAAALIGRLMAADLRALDIDTNCTPVLDVPVPGAHDIIGDRAYGTAPEAVVALAGAVAHGHMDGGVVPVMKHIPGHGRATADSHLDLPVVTTPRATLAATDFAPFRALAGVVPAAMTAHVVYGTIDGTGPATTSAVVVREVIRGEIGFDGLLMTDDLGMKALSGPLRTRAERSIAAGCDVVLHCSGDLAEMEAVAAGTPVLAGPARSRFDAAVAVTRRVAPFDAAAADACAACLADLLASDAADVRLA
jgi:beta-N-acetylhexosaminidase